MKKSLLLKHFLLLFALVVGSMSVWGQRITAFSEDFTTNKTIDLLTTAGWTLDGKVSMNSSNLNGPALQVASGKGNGTATTPVFSSLASTTATLTFNIASSGSSTNTLTITGNDCLVDGETSTTASTADGSVTIELTNASSTSSITFSANKNNGCVIDDIVVSYISGPTYTITALSNNDEWGTVSGTYSITATPATGYRISTTTPYTVSPAGSATVVQTENVFDVTPSANTTITINFEAIPVYTISYSVNGAIIKEVEIAEGESVDLSAPISNIPTGYVFTGWSEAEILTPQATAPSYVSSATSTMDKTYYAVFARTIGGTPATLTKMVQGDNFAIGDNIVIVANVGANYYGLYQETVGGSYVQYYSFSESVTTIASDDKNWLTVAAGSTSGKWKLGDATNGYLYSSGSNNLSIDKDNFSDWSLEDNEDGTFSLTQGRYLSCRSDLTTENQYRFRLAGSNPNGTYVFTIYKYTAGSATYSDYCTTVAIVTITAAGYKAYNTTMDTDFSETEDLTAFVVTDASPTNITLTEVDAVPAGKPVILKGAPGDYTLKAAASISGYSDDNNKLIVSNGTVGNGTTYFALGYIDGEVGFYRVGEGVTIPTNYLVIVDVPSGQNAIGFEEGTTGIQNIERTVNDNQYYTLDGRRVAEPTKGLYIINGKKVVIK